MRAKARRTIKKAKRTSWQNYISKINSRTPMKKNMGYDQENE